MNWECLIKSFFSAVVILGIMAALIAGWIWLLSNTPLYVPAIVGFGSVLLFVWVGLYGACKKEEENSDAESK